MLRRRLPLLASIAVVLLACPSDDDRDDGSVTIMSGQGTAPADEGSTSEDVAGSTGGAAECTNYVDAFENCGLGGCGQGPTTLNGMLLTGGACSMAAECAPVLCSCPSDATVQWFAATCGCGQCNPGPIACERSMALGGCT